MHQRRQDVALAHQPLRERARGQALVGQLERDLAFEQPVGAFGQPHAAHATAAQFTQKSIGSHHAFALGDCRRRRFRGYTHPGQRVQEVLCLDMRVVVEQQLQRVPVRALTFGKFVEPRPTLLLGQVERLVEQRRDRRPMLDVNLHRRNAASICIRFGGSE